MAQLFTTLLQNLPVGVRLVLEVGAEEPFVSRTLVGAPETDEKVTEHLLDGQQRLTALWRGLHNNYEDRTYFVNFTPDEESGLPYHVMSVARWRKDGESRRRPFWADNPKEQWRRKLVPLDLLRSDHDSMLAYQAWSKEAVDTAEEREELSMTISLIRQHLHSYNIPFISLPATTPREVALDVFIRMNTSAAPLTIYDIVVAQVEASMGKSLHEMISGLREVCPTITHYYQPENLILYSGALLQGRQPTNSTYMDRAFGVHLFENWELFLRGTARTVEFLEQEKVFDEARLPTDVVIPVLVALWAEAPEGLDAEGRARMILRKYIWRAFFTARYENSTNSRALADFQALKNLINGQAEKLPPIFNDEEYPLPSPEELLSAGWPVRKDRLARAILALSLRHGGLDLADGSGVSRAHLARREYHHLFPVAHLSKQGVNDEKIFRSLNCALITWRTNRNISAKEPERYLAERLDGTGVTQDELRQRLTSHLIPYDETVRGDYETFIAKRAHMVHEAMVSLCAD